jgi:hypothetical protein
MSRSLAPNWELSNLSTSTCPQIQIPPSVSQIWPLTKEHKKVGKILTRYLLRLQMTVGLKNYSSSSPDSSLLSAQHPFNPTLLATDYMSGLRAVAHQAPHTGYTFENFKSR